MQKIPGGNVMKTLPLAILSTAIVLASCSSTKNTAASEYDDIYYNPNKVERDSKKQAKKDAEIALAVEQALAEQQSVSGQQTEPQTTMTAMAVNQEPVYGEYQVMGDENMSDYERYQLQREAEMLGETYAPEGSEALYANQYQEYDSIQQVGVYDQASAPVVVNNYNYYTDPNEYYYSSNLRRFSDEYYGWNYNDPYYSSPYGYGGRGPRWGMSMGYGMGYGMGIGFSWGYPGYGYGYGRYYDPWCGYGGYGGYYPGYGYGGSYWSGVV